MSKRDMIVPGGDSRLRRFRFYLEASDAELETLTFSRLADIVQQPEVELPREELAALACRIYDARRARAHFLQDSLLGEPVWDMLLALYCLPTRGEVLSVSGLCHAASVPATTALRWSQLMEQKKLIRRTRDKCDGRRVYLALTEEGDAVMSSYLASVFNMLSVK